MSAQHDTLPPDHEQEQAMLTDNLIESGDPMARLIAHMSMRQLAMVEHLREMREELSKVASALEANNESRATILRRLDDLEQLQHQNGSSTGDKI